jgi:hypothetical protein
MIKRRYWVSTTVWANIALYEAGLKADCKLRKLRATLGLSVHPTNVSYTNLFPAAAAT